MTKEQIGNHILNGCILTMSEKEVGDHLLKICVDENYIEDWYINSIENKNPHWTPEHIKELCTDFYLIPKN